MFSTIPERAVRRADARPATPGSDAAPQRCRFLRVSQRITSATHVIHRVVSLQPDATWRPVEFVTTSSLTFELRLTHAHFATPLVMPSMATRSGWVAPIATGYRRVCLNLVR